MFSSSKLPCLTCLILAVSLYSTPVLGGRPHQASTDAKGPIDDEVVSAGADARGVIKVNNKSTAALVQVHALRDAEKGGEHAQADDAIHADLEDNARASKTSNATSNAIHSVSQKATEENGEHSETGDAIHADSEHNATASVTSGAKSNADAFLADLDHNSTASMALNTTSNATQSIQSHVQKAAEAGGEHAETSNAIQADLEQNATASTEEVLGMSSGTTSNATHMQKSGEEGGEHAETGDAIHTDLEHNATASMASGSTSNTTHRASMKFSGFPGAYGKYFNGEFFENKAQSAGGRSIWQNPQFNASGDVAQEPIIFWCASSAQPSWVLSVRSYLPLANGSARGTHECFGYATVAGDPATLVHVDKVFVNGAWLTPLMAPWVKDIKVVVATSVEGGVTCKDLIDSAGFKFIQHPQFGELAGATFGSGQGFVCGMVFGQCPSFNCNYNLLKQNWQGSRDRTRTLMQNYTQSTDDVLFNEVDKLVSQDCLWNLHDRCLTEQSYGNPPQQQQQQNINMAASTRISMANPYSSLPF